MCGIAGLFGKVDKNLLIGMCNSLKHRGPDDYGYYFGQEVALGNRRLSILDIKGGHQPIHNEDETIWIVFNGEIYNYQEIRKNLKPKHAFYTNSDTEVIVHAYEEYGEDCLGKFNGMWAFAIWDLNKELLFLSRDRFGIKPLYYLWDGKTFLFASEIKAILQDKTVKRIKNDKIIYEYLIHGRHDHAEETFFKNVKRLMPAHFMKVGRNGIEIQRYWQINALNEEMDFSHEKDEEYAKEFRELLEDSIRLRLIGEVPVGSCLSGGIDSSSIVCIINKLWSSQPEVKLRVGERQKTFSSCSFEKEIDERVFIEEVVRFTNVEKNYVFPSSRELLAELKDLIFYQDEPFTSLSVYAQWSVMKLASRKVTVLLDGQGGDELLAGYRSYYGRFLRDLWKKKKVFHLLREILQGFDIILPYLPRYFNRIWKGEVSYMRMFNPHFVTRFGKDVGDQKASDFVEMLKNDLEDSLPALLRYEDRNSMAFSVEARVPFLDHRLVEYVFSLPITERIKNGWTKVILRNAMRGTIPEKIRRRRGKIGFAAPQIRWMIELREEITKIFASEEFGRRGYFNQDEILGIFDQLCRGKVDYNLSDILWRILNLELWFQTFFDNESTLRPTK